MKFLIALASLVLLVAAATVFVACEAESSTEKVKISPDSATIHVGQSIEFTASQGYEYTWSLKNKDWGMLSNLEGEKTTYTSLKNVSSNAGIQELTVMSTISGTRQDDASTNATTPYTVSATAYITHL
jgi:hypothetical protein